MKCTHCGNELSSEMKFCGKCGGKVEAGKSIKQTMGPKIEGTAQQSLDREKVQSVKRQTPQSVPYFGAGTGCAVKVKRASGFPFGKLLILMVILAIGFFVYKEVDKRFLSPIGVWTSEDTPIELKFKENGTFQVGAYGNFAGELRWKRESFEKYYLSGVSPEMMGISLGEIGCYAELDIFERTLTIDFGFGKILFRKEE